MRDGAACCCPMARCCYLLSRVWLAVWDSPMRVIKCAVLQGRVDHVGFDHRRHRQRGATLTGGSMLSCKYVPKERE